jgi:hypothetical protein
MAASKSPASRKAYLTADKEVRRKNKEAGG